MLPPVDLGSFRGVSIGLLVGFVRKFGFLVPSSACFLMLAQLGAGVALKVGLLVVF